MHLFHQGIKGWGIRAYHPGYLRCWRAKRNLCANAGSIPYGEFERFIVDLIGGFSIPEGEAGGPGCAPDELAERLAEAKASAGRTYDSVKTWMSGSPSPLVLARIGELEAEHAKLTTEVDTLEKQIATARGKGTPPDEIAAIRLILAEVQSSDPAVRLLARARVAAGMKRFIAHILCFPNRGVIGEYDLGGVMCVVRCWLTPDGRYEVYHTDWDWGARKGKPWLMAPVEDWQNYARDFDPNSHHTGTRRIADVGDMVVEEYRPPTPGWKFPLKVAEVVPDFLALQPEDFIRPKRTAKDWGRTAAARALAKTIAPAEETS